MKGHLAAQPLSSTLLAPDQSDRMAGTGRKPTDRFGLNDGEKQTFLDRNWAASVDTNAANGSAARRVTDHDPLKDGPTASRD
jgi:hypothetical protein